MVRELRGIEIPRYGSSFAGVLTDGEAYGVAPLFVPQDAPKAIHSEGLKSLVRDAQGEETLCPH